MKFKIMLFANLCFVVTVFLLHLNSVEGVGDVRCMDNERRALLEFKAGVFDDGGMLSSWGDNSNECCNWKGVYCSNRTGHVTLLNLPGIVHLNTWLRLSGEVSPSLSELKHLKYLNLSHNDFGGKVPPQLGNLTNLRSLDLGYNGYFYMELQNLDLVSRLRLLTHLDLSGVNLGNCSDWLNQINKFSTLTHLHLSGCNLPNQFGPLTNISFPAFNSLVVADLSSNCFISPKSYNWLFNFTTTLVSLDLSSSLFQTSEISKAIGRIVSLESLALSNCNLGGTLPSSFMNLTRLATLHLDYNNFNGLLSEFLHPLATKEKNLIQVLNLQNNQLRGSLPDYITKFICLREMLISNNNLSGPFPDNYSQLSSTLVHLDLSNNQLTGSLPNLALFSSLEKLILSNNKLEDTILEAYLSTLSKLSHLDLSSNSLCLKLGTDWVAPFQLDAILFRNCTLGPHFPNWIKSQRNFSVLDISQANISDKIPIWFWDLSQTLTYINMSNNQIQGILPNSSHIFPDLEWLDLSYNLLQGPLPTLPVQLVYLDITHNKFTESLLCTTPYTKLKYLDVSHNKLFGELVVNCLTNSQQLSTLYLGNNDFSGNIPTSIGLLNQLSILQLCGNNFTGKLPLSLINITGIQLLDLSENKLSGKVPSWIGTSLTSLVILSLHDNEFSGSIPPQICQLRNAQVLDFSQNTLTGSIPNCINNITSLVEKETTNDYGAFSDTYESNTLPAFKLPNAVVQWKGFPSEYERTLKYLKLIDLSSNRLVREIPKAFESLKGLLSLNLSFNSLTGNIIPKIGQMESLESLDLSRNKLSGKIPSRMASLTFLSVLNLSNNNLKGEIPTSTQLQSFEPSSYAGNEHLCGLPLSNKCGGEHSLPTGHDDKDRSNEDHDDKLPKSWLYVSMVLGFATGFWGFMCPIMFRRTWRHSYYKVLSNITDWIYVTTKLCINGLRRKFYG